MDRTQNSKTPPKRRTIKAFGNRPVYHFKSLDARRKAQELVDGSLRNSELVTAAVIAKQIPPDLVDQRQTKLRGVAYENAPPRQVKPIQQVRLATGRKLEPDEWLIHLSAMIEIAKGNGWRTPSAKAKNWRSTSAIMKASEKAGLSKPNSFERSDRGKKKHEAKIESKALAWLDRMIEEFPDHAARAKTNERLLNWFIARIEERYYGEINREWLTAQVKERIKRGERDFKYLHSAEKARRHNIRKIQEAA